MLDKLRAAFKKKPPPEFEITSYDKPNLSFKCADKLKLQVTSGVAKMPDGETHPMTLVVWTHDEEKGIYWAELVSKGVEETLHQFWPPPPKKSKW